MNDKELIKWFKKYTAITKKDNEIAETVGLELSVEISVEVAELLINLIEKQQKEIENSVSKDKIREIIEKERYKTTSSYNDWKYDENVYKAEKNMINILEDVLLKERLKR